MHWWFSRYVKFLNLSDGELRPDFVIIHYLQTFFLKKKNMLAFYAFPLQPPKGLLTNLRTWIPLKVTHPSGQQFQFEYIINYEQAKHAC